MRFFVSIYFLKTNLLNMIFLKDLVDDDVMVLDSGHEIYVWVGIHSTEQEREAGFNMASVNRIDLLNSSITFVINPYYYAGILAY